MPLQQDPLLTLSFPPNWVTKTAFNRPRGSRWEMIQRLQDLDFVDDICMLSHRLQDANNQMERLNTTAQIVGLKIHPGKTKVLRINAIQQGEVRLDQSYIEEVEEFTYHGSVMNKTGGTDEDIAARRKKAQQAFAMLTPVWRSKDLRTATKIRIFNTNVKAVLLYGSETWRVTTASTKQVQTFINKCLRRILRVYWPEVIFNKDLWVRTGQEPIVTTIKRRRWKWIGHTLREGERNIARHAMDWNPQGTRKRGRPRIKWRRSIQKDLKEINMTWCEAKRAAQDRQKWKAIVDALCLAWDKED